MDARDFDGADGVDGDLVLAPQRTSVLAILALICALICIIPGTGLLAIVFGISALVGINSSRGRVGGTGLAISGLVLGLVFSLLWVAIAVGATQMLNVVSAQFVQPINQSVTAVDTGDFKSARTLLDPAAGAAVTDEEFQKFRAAYQAEMGSFKGLPQGIDLIAAYFQVANSMQSVQGRNDVIPIPASFDKGTAVLLLQVDQSTMPNKQGKRPATQPTTVDDFHIKNLLLLTPSGTMIELTGSGITLPGTTTAPPAPGTPATPPEPGAKETVTPVPGDK